MVLMRPQRAAGGKILVVTPRARPALSRTGHGAKQIKHATKIPGS